MDQTQLFVATVRTVRLRLKAQRRDKGSVNDSSILSKSTHKPTQFSQEASDVARCVSKLQEFLLKHRKEYIDSLGHLISKASSMSDTERDQIDSEAQQFIQSCSERIRNLHKDVSSVMVGQQSRQHRQAVYESLGEYLKAVCKLYSEQRAIRVKRIVDRKRTARLQPDGLKKPSLEVPAPQRDSPTPDNSEPANDGEGGVSEEQAEGEDVAVPIVSEAPTTTQLDNSNQTGLTSNQTGLTSEQSGLRRDDEMDNLTEEEKATFEQENEQIFAEMNTLVDEVRQIEGKVIEISKLQEIFADKILVQAKQLDVISDQTVVASENVTSGNEQIRQAIKNKASFRLWILFILIMCSFSLLFLDWYS